jgi:hypothetical protein
MPDKPAQRLPRKQIETKLTVIHRKIHKEREVCEEDHVEKVLKKNGAALGTKHRPPNSENIIGRTGDHTGRKKNQKADKLR